MENISHYDLFMSFLNPKNGDIRSALFDLFFPGKQNTRSVSSYRYKVIPLLLDLLEHYYQVDAVIEANQFFFKLCDNFEYFSGQTMDSTLCYNFIKYLSQVLK